ncbi:restriction endonuclease S subunit [Owenweeksia hongkongensis DSM 17368]|uniref:Restriction endonuclease S subunit n=1 Tax=Owenweeksia hongkongensis (strain DSM 17368 / CIP 108786 / JCM 12287 / NRRL B-23963 / UST20020801) TaxID=926562 RepID=G8R4C4_OWEHD|nr:restriction endonuclease subunit S [Owenweeksia hongkongensis]AEV34224.1 restriction endonuclease S subunit [Owenweeksia hongkongensis DSM 17368]
MKEGWKRITMLEACNLITCGVAARPKYVDDGVPFLSAKNVKEGRIIYEDYNCITEENHHELTKKNKPLVGDILYTRVGSYGEAAVIEEEIEFSIFVSLTLIKPKKDILSSYFLKYYLNSHEVKTLATNSITSSGVGNLNVGTVRKFPVPIPPLTEQKQIVAILDKAFAAIDQAKANIEKNIQNAKELFQSKLNEIFSHPSTGSGQDGDGWEEKSIEDITEVINGYSFKSKDFSAENDIKAIKITNVGIMEFVEDSSNNLPSSYLEEYSKVKVHEGDLVLALTRTIISGGLKVAQVPKSYHNSLLNQRVAAIVPNLELVDRDYLFYFFSSNRVYNYVLDNVNTLMQPNLSIGDLKKLPVPLPPVERQRELRLLIEALSNNRNQLVRHYSAKLNGLEDLKKSILQKAFAGELIKEETESILQVAAEPGVEYETK